MKNLVKKLVALVCVCVAFVATPVFADYQKGLDAFSNGDYAAAVAEWRPLAEKGDVKAQFNLGLMYKLGRGVPQSYKEMIKWYTLSAEQGEATAQYNLGVSYRNGEGVPQDYKKAVKWTRLAAEQGLSNAQNNLGVLYEKGQGVSQDYVRAHMWANLASSNGDETAPEFRDFVAEKMTDEEITRAQDLAQECFAKNYKDC